VEYAMAMLKTIQENYDNISEKVTEENSSRIIQKLEYYIKEIGILIESLNKPNVKEIFVIKSDRNEEFEIKIHTNDDVITKIENRWDVKIPFHKDIKINKASIEAFVSRNNGYYLVNL